GEKNDVLNNDLINAEKKVELIKHICQSTEKKICACLQTSGTGSDPSSLEKRYKKLPEIQLHMCFQELGELVGTDTVLGQTLVECSEIEKQIGQETVNYELNVEKHCLSLLNNLLENDIPMVFKCRKQLNKATQDRDNLRQRYQAAMRQSTQSSGSVATFANKAQCLKKDLEESNTKVEQSKDSFASEVFSMLGRESELSNIYLQYLKVQLYYYKTVSAILETTIPNVEQVIVTSSQKPCFGCSLEEHLRVNDKEVSIVIETCVGWLLNNLNEEGLFRIPGSTSKVKKLKCSFDAGFIDVDDYANDPHTVAGCLKSYLRELPEPLLTHTFYEEWINAATVSDSNARLQALWQVCNKLPKSNYSNLKYIVKFLAKLTQNSNVNKMSSQNIAIAMAPSLIWPPDTESDDVSFGLNMSAANIHSVIVDCLVTYADWFFPGEMEFTTLPIFGALLNGDDESHVAPAPKTVPRVLKKPAPPAPPVDKQGVIDDNLQSTTLPRSSARSNYEVVKPHRPSVKDRTSLHSDDESVYVGDNQSMNNVRSLDRNQRQKFESVRNEKKTSLTRNESKGIRSCVEKPSVPPPCVPCSGNGAKSKNERPSSVIERPSKPPPERPQRLCDRNKEVISDDAATHNTSATALSSSIESGVQISSTEMEINSVDPNFSCSSDKDSIAFVDESEEELILGAMNSKSSDETDQITKEELTTSSENVTDIEVYEQRYKVKPPRPSPPVMKPKPNLNENTYL
ncbi:rho GTPase-activating protein 44-like protein, partial [Leptotrombidium deliense]